MLIGFDHDDYIQRRCIIGAVADARYRPVFNAARGMSDATRWLAAKGLALPSLQGWAEGRFIGPVSPRMGMLHLFNAIPVMNHKPWVCTFETVVPRYTATRTVHWGAAPDYAGVSPSARCLAAQRAIASPACFGLLALSECNRQMELSFLRSMPAPDPRIERKLIVLPPPQPLFATATPRIEIGKSVKFLFVGGAFHRKGGMETVRTLARLRREHRYPIELTVISNLLRDPYATQETASDIAAARDLLKANAEWITWPGRLGNRDVLGLMAEAHVGLLPTHADTYGFSVLEMQASACPVITTDIRALPEINTPETGWLIRVPKNRLSEALYTTFDERRRLSAAIETGLERAVHEIFANLAELPRKADAAHDRIRQFHDPGAYGMRLKEIYEGALVN